MLKIRSKGSLNFNVVVTLVIGVLFSLTLMGVIVDTMPDRAENAVAGLTPSSEGSTPTDGDSSDGNTDEPDPGEPGDDDPGGNPSSTCNLDSSASLSVGFESSSYVDKFTELRYDNRYLSSNDPFAGSNSLRVKYNGGGHRGASMDYRFRDEGMNEPEELYAQYALKFGENWRADRNGKLPGFAGTYGEAGWGGRPSNGENGWSARGVWKEGSSPQRTKLGYYVYHADMTGQYGSSWAADQELENGNWYCVNQYIKLNTPGENDGILRLWIDGEKAWEKTDIRFRDTRDLKIHKYWANFYYGGSWDAPSDMNVYMDNLVVSKTPISSGDSSSTSDEGSSPTSEN